MLAFCHVGQAKADAGDNDPALSLRRECTDSIDSIYVAPEDLASADVNRRGEVVRCSTGEDHTVEQLHDPFSHFGYYGYEARTGVRALRIQYRTERLKGVPGVSAAIVFLPHHLIDRHAPLVLYAHGYRADALSHHTIEDDGAVASAAALAAHGYVVVAPDYPGYMSGAGSPASVFAEDEAHAVLDATRAIGSLLSLHGMSKEWVFFGHSQGGHTVLSAQAYASSYGLAGSLHTVVPVTPGWRPLRGYGWSLSDEAGLNTHDNYGQVWTASALTYFTGHAALYDGEAVRFSMIRGEKLPILLRVKGQSDIVLLGDRPSDIFTPEFLAGIVPCATTGKDEDCTSELAQKWRPRFRADRPTLDPHGADVLEWIAGQDELITLSNYRCGIDKIREDLAHSAVNYKICVDRPSGHGPAFGRQLGWFTQWLDSTFLGAEPPEDCPGEESLGQSFQDLECGPPAGNND